MAECFFRHKWGPWGQPFWGGAANDYQRRHCIRCGLTQQRIVGMTPEPPTQAGRSSLAGDERG